MTISGPAEFCQRRDADEWVVTALLDSEDVSDDPGLTAAGRSEDQDLLPELVQTAGARDGNSISVY